MNTEITNAVTAADDKSQYDEYAKHLLSQKIILAHILVKTVDEFKGMNPKDVAAYIEGEPYVSMVPSEPGLTNKEKKDKTGQRIIGLNTENSEAAEGVIRFDIIFYVRMKDGLSQIIVNVEAQKNEPTAYKILNRAVFYVSRLISSQKERDFVNTNYDDIKCVFSIWICMNMDTNSMSHIHLTKNELLEPCGWKGNISLFNIILIGISNELPEYDERYELHRLIGALLSRQLKPGEKLDIMEKEYDIPVNDSFRKDINIMCNLGEGIEEMATEEVNMKCIMNMHRKGYPPELIAEIVEISIEEVNTVIGKKESLPA
ncbi:MAG: hypothetical protein J6C64_14445 [Lachnospiraceae bacterium]|nr:hypothetical protein [Lachnospiraceae bacterium]